MPLGIYCVRTQGKAGNRREGKGRAGQGKGWKGGEEGQHKQKNSTIAWRFWENDCGQEEQHVIRVRRDGKVAALASTRQRNTQEPVANHTRRHGTKKHTRQHRTAHFPLALERFSFL